VETNAKNGNYFSAVTKGRFKVAFNEDILLCSSVNVCSNF